MEHAVADVRKFNRFYTRQIGLLGEKHLDSRWTLTELRVLYELANDDAPMAAQIGRGLALDPGYLSRILRKFEAAGLLRRERDPSDGRASILRLTSDGARVFASVDARSHDMIAGLLEPLTPSDRERIVSAMATIETVLDHESPGEPGSNVFRLRPHAPGDVGWIIARHGAIYAEEYGWGATFEAHVAEIAGRFLKDFKPGRERAFIAERNGRRLGAVIVVQSEDDPSTAQLRLLIAEPCARGLGLGRRLVEACSTFARDAGYARIKLWTHECLTDARRLYAAHGYVVVERHRHDTFGVEIASETWERMLDRPCGPSRASA